MKIKVQFIHGLEGSPQGQKAQYLARYFELRAPAMDTHDFAASVDAQRAALADFSPGVVVGSSFGGAVAVELLRRKDWCGPTVLLAPAVGHFGVRVGLPANVPVIVVHGTHDEILDVATSRKLAETGTPSLVRFVEVDDRHRLTSLLETERLADLVREAFELGRTIS